MPNDFNPPLQPSNPLSGSSLRPELASPNPVWWTPNVTNEFPIPATFFEAKCGYCNNVPAHFVLSTSEKSPKLQLPINDQLLEKKPLTWLGSLTAATFDLALEPLLHYVTCSWRGRLKNDITIDVTGGGIPPQPQALSLRWYLFYGKTDTETEYASTPTFGPLGLAGLLYRNLAAAVSLGSSIYATGPYRYSDDSRGDYFGPSPFDAEEQILLDIEGWALVLLHHWTSTYNDPITTEPVPYPIWSLVSAYRAKNSFKCCEPTTWELRYNPCNQPDHEIVSTPFQP